MRRVFTLLLFVVATYSVSAQWTTGTNIYNTNSGNVGIGTPIPATKLDVNGGVSIQSNNNLTWGGVHGAGVPTITGALNYGLYFFPSGTTSGLTMRIDQNGNVGIGTPTPSAKLEVNGQIAITSNNNNYLKIGSYNTTSDNFAYISSAGQTGGTGLKFETTNGNATDGVTRMIILNSGNVGIGTINPQAKLEVSGGVSFTNGRLYQSGDIPNDNNAQFFNSSPTGYGLYSQGGSGGRYAFHFVNQEGNTILYGRGDGNVSIGTTDPKSYKLAVAGKAIAEEIVVKLQANWPDYVFEETYQLPSLTEVARYIKQHKHLPEIPSAKEMEENGVQLGEMNMLLLRKIEELTLYVIEQNKIIEKLQEERDSSPDISGKKIEELTLYVIELTEESQKQQKIIEEQQKQIDTILNK